MAEAVESLPLMGDLDGVPGFWPRPGSALAVVRV